ncbi:MAG: response regulator [Akkermansiaceae bacterium]|nr:response regulator [Armatimonadota bacterium]
MAHILVVDDENNIRMMLRLALSHVGHTVETAADGYEGLEKFANGAGWDLVLLDQRMPGLEGLEVLREMRQRRANTRVLMITAFGTVDLATEAMAAGANDFLRKPFTVETLRGAVTSALTGERDGKTRSAALSMHSFDSVTVNGFRLLSSGSVMVSGDGGFGASYTVMAPTGEENTCRIVIPCYVVELVKAHTDREEMPEGERFWQALCGEALANHLWQHAQLPPDGTLLVDDLTSGLRHWIDAVISRTGD